MPKTHQRDFTRNVPIDVVRYIPSFLQAHYLIISKTYQRDDVRERDRQRDHFQKCYIFVARRTRRRASLVALVVALVCGQSRDFRVCRRIPRRAHIGVFCIYTH